MRFTRSLRYDRCVLLLTPGKRRKGAGERPVCATAGHSRSKSTSNPSSLGRRRNVRRSKDWTLRRDIALSFIEPEKHNNRLHFDDLSSSLLHLAYFSTICIGQRSFGKENRHRGANASERDRVGVEISPCHLSLPASSACLLAS